MELRKGDQGSQRSREGGSWAWVLPMGIICMRAKDAQQAGYGGTKLPGISGCRGGALH